jgi:hypothetical protein
MFGQGWFVHVGAVKMMVRSVAAGTRRMPPMAVPAPTFEPVHTVAVAGVVFGGTATAVAAVAVGAVPLTAWVNVHETEQ